MGRLKDKSAYIANGDCPVSLWDLMSVQKYKRSSEKIEDLQLNTMIIMLVKLFLWEEEIGGMRIVDFQSDLFIIDDTGKISAFVVNVLGKTNNIPVTLMLYPDLKNQLLFPVMHLMVYHRDSGTKI